MTNSITSSPFLSKEFNSILKLWTVTTISSMVMLGTLISLNQCSQDSQDYSFQTSVCSKIDELEFRQMLTTTTHMSAYLLGISSPLLGISHLAHSCRQKVGSGFIGKIMGFPAHAIEMISGAVALAPSGMGLMISTYTTCVIGHYYFTGRS